MSISTISILALFSILTALRATTAAIPECQKLCKFDKEKYYFLVQFHKHLDHQVVPYICTCARWNVFLRSLAALLYNIDGLRVTILALHICKFS